MVAGRDVRNERAIDIDGDDAVVAGATFNIFHAHAKRVKMANIAQLVNVLQALILTEGEKMLLTPTYHVFDMYQVHHDATFLPLDLQTDDYTQGAEKIPARGAAVLVANHRSLLDIFALYGVHRHFKWVAKSSLFQQPAGYVQFRSQP